LAYVPAFIDATKNPGPGAPQFLPESPVPVEQPSTTPVSSINNKSTITIAKQ